MTLSQASFYPHIGTTFIATVSTEQIQPLVLKEIQQSENTPAGFDVYSLIFHGISLHPLPQGTYMFQHEKLGKQAIFIVPISRCDNGFDYQACFNIQT